MKHKTLTSAAFKKYFVAECFNYFKHNIIEF